MITTTIDSAHDLAVNPDEPLKFLPGQAYARLMWAAVGMLLAALIGVIFAVIDYDWTRSIGIIVITAAVGGIGGAAIGFLFGIPRVLTDASPAPIALAVATGAAPGSSGATPQRRYLASNSNLEQVSDWLTKIILGVGLTQFYQLDSALVRFEDLVARHVAVTDVVTPLVSAIVIVFAVLCGFLAMYLETRLVLSRIFDSVERDLDKAEKDKLQAERNLAASEVRRENAQGQADVLESAVEKIAADPLTPATMLVAAADSLKSAASTSQASDAIRSIAAQALAASGRTDEASSLLGSGEDASVRNRISAMQVALYKPAPAGFTEALAIAADLSWSVEAKANADYWFFQCAAFGQQHHHLLADPSTPQREEALQSARDNALDCLARCLKIDGSYKIRFFWLMNPGLSSSRDDDDLVDFVADTGFLALVGDAPSVSPQEG